MKPITKLQISLQTKIYRVCRKDIQKEHGVFVAISSDETYTFYRDIESLQGAMNNVSDVSVPSEGTIVLVNEDWVIASTLSDDERNVIGNALEDAA